MGNKSLSKKSKFCLKVAGIILIFVAAILAILFLLKGSSTVTGNWEEDNSITLSCDATNINYPMFQQENSRGNIKVNIVLKNDNINTLSLLYKTSYDNKDAVKAGRNASSKALEESYVKDGLALDSLNMKFSELDENILQMSLYINDNDIKQNIYKYFMLGNLDHATNHTKDTIQKIYTDQNFKCTISE